MRRNGNLGRPGIRHNAKADPQVIHMGCLYRPIWVIRSLPMSASEAERVTMRPVATDSSRAGIWETRPSPTVSSE